MFTAYSYGFLRYGLKLFDSDFRNVYGVVCKNTNIFCQYIKEIEVDEKGIIVILKKQAMVYILGFGEDKPFLSDFYAALNIHTELLEQYKDKEIYVSTGAIGSSDKDYSIDDGCFYFEYYCNYETMEQILLNEYINKIVMRNVHFNNIEGQLPANTSVNELRIITDLNAPELRNFEGLNTLELKVSVGSKSTIGWVSDDLRLNMEFLNELPHLETVTVNSYSSLINFSETECGNIKQFTLHTDECTDELEKTIKAAFPNAEIEIVCD